MTRQATQPNKRHRATGVFCAAAAAILVTACAAAGLSRSWRALRANSAITEVDLTKLPSIREATPAEKAKSILELQAGDREIEASLANLALSEVSQLPGTRARRT